MRNDFQATFKGILGRLPAIDGDGGCPDSHQEKFAHGNVGPQIHGGVDDFFMCHPLGILDNTIGHVQHRIPVQNVVLAAVAPFDAV